MATTNSMNHTAINYMLYLVEHPRIKDLISYLNQQILTAAGPLELNNFFNTGYTNVSGLRVER